MFVGVKATNDENVDLAATQRFRILDRACGKLIDRLSLQYLFYPSSFLVPQRRWFREADIVQLYNLHGGYFAFTALPLLTRQHPVVWRLSDMWSFTGHCTYSYDCERWKIGCGACPILGDYPKLYRDTTALLWRTKRWIYEHSALTIVAPSRWIGRLAKTSPLLERFRIEIIPNGLDTEIFRPVPKERARQLLAVDPSAKVVLFSAQFVRDRRKGGEIVFKVVKRLSQEVGANLNLLVVGTGDVDSSLQASCAIKHLGTISSDEQLAAAYSAADVFVLPTLADNLPNGILESMACGTPAVAFAVGGTPEAVRHMETGYLARAGNAADLTAGIEMILSD